MTIADLVDDSEVEEISRNDAQDREKIPLTEDAAEKKPQIVPSRNKSHSNNASSVAINLRTADEKSIDASLLNGFKATTYDPPDGGLRFVQNTSFVLIFW